MYEMASATEQQLVEILDDDAFVPIGIVHAGCPCSNGFGDFDVFEDRGEVDPFPDSNHKLAKRRREIVERETVRVLALLPNSF